MGQVISTGGRLAAAGIVVAMLGGCFMRHENPCASEEEYQAAQTVSQIAVPEGLDKPDQSVRLNIPDGPKPAEPLARNAACLQRPPNYFDKPPKDSSN